LLGYRRDHEEKKQGNEGWFSHGWFDVTEEEGESGRRVSRFAWWFCFDLEIYIRGVEGFFLIYKKKKKIYR